MLSTKADANRKHTLTLSISKLVSLLSSKKQFSLTREVNLKIKELIAKRVASEQFTRKMCRYVYFVALHD